MDKQKEVIASARAGFDRLENMLEDTTNALQVGTDGFDRLVLLVEEMDRQFQNVAVIQKKLTEDNGPFIARLAALLAETNQVLDAVVQAMTAGDVVLLTDLLQYELKPRLKKWSDLMTGWGEPLN